MNSNKKYLYVNNIPVEVSQEVYKAYWQEVEKERYMAKVSRERLIYLDHYFEGYESNTLEYKIVSKIEKIENERNTEMIEKLLIALSKLTEEERLIIELLYYDGFNQTESAQYLGVSKKNISRKHKRIKAKLKRLINAQE